LTRLQRFALVAALVLIAVPAATANAARQMPVGFFDDVSFRFSPDAQQNLAAASAAGASVIHTTANWSLIAATRPANAANGDDPAYKLTDLDDLVANASRSGLRVMINITGTPKWANGNHTANYLPKSTSTFATFARMLATRYNGHNGHGSVSLYSVWNEPNLQQFLYPQYSGKKIVGPLNYGKLFKVAYAAIKAGNPLAKVAVGETSAQGRDKPATGVSATVSPGTFAKVLSTVKGLKFDAWAHHPYPTARTAKPLEKVRYPNVTLSTLPTFEANLKKEFHKVVPIWITEYGHETKPAQPKGISTSLQASYAKQALTIARADPNVQMFIWFTFRDNSGNPWKSGVENSNGTHKPSFSSFSALARLIDGTMTTVKAGKAPTVTMYLPTIGSNVEPGSSIGMTYRVFDGAKPVTVGQPTALLAADNSVKFIANFKPVKGHTYTVTSSFNDINGVTESQTATVVAS
jgi:cellulase (glycosyl hydrolase family 5)